MEVEGGAVGVLVEGGWSWDWDWGTGWRGGLRRAVGSWFEAEEGFEFLAEAHGCGRVDASGVVWVFAAGFIGWVLV